MTSRPLSRQEQKLFTHQVAAMLTAGVNLVAALEAVRAHSDKALQEIALEVSTRVSSGHYFSQALGYYPEAFAADYVSLIRMGEETGRLAAIMTHLADWLDRDLRLITRLRSALTYPALVVTVALSLAVAMVYLILPGFLEVLRTIPHLPWPTRLLIQAVDLARGPSVVLVLITCLLAGRGLWAYQASPEGKRSLRLAMLQLPGLGPFAQSISLARFSLAMQIALNSGMGLAKCLELASQISDNPHIVEDLPGLRAHIENGGEVWDHLASRREIYPAIFVQMVRTGEETSKGPKLYGLLACWFEGEAEVRSHLLLTMLEPLLLLFLGTMVAGLLLCVFLPIYQSLGGSG